MELALELGLEGLVRYQQGDFVESAPSLPPAAIVVMDKVLCCYADPLRLVKTAAAHCTGLLAVSYPRNGLLARVSFRFAARLGKLFRVAFHPFYHDPGWLHRTVIAEGFTEVYAQSTLIWQIGVFRRVGGMERSVLLDPELVAVS